MSFVFIPLIAEKGGGQTQVTGQFEDSKTGEVFKEQIIASTMEGLKAAAKSRIETLSNKYDLIAELKPLLFQPLDLTLPVPKDPAPKEAFAIKIRTLRSMMRAIDMKIKSSVEDDYKSLVASLTQDLINNPNWLDTI